MRVLITGANGFVGRALSEDLRPSHAVRTAVRSDVAAESLPPGIDSFVVGDLGPKTRWREALTGVEVVVHLAARVHVLRDRAPEPLEEFRRVNVAGTERLARAAAAEGVRRIVYLSSLGVNGDSSGPLPLTEEAPPRPHTGYAVSKWEAEQSLLAIGRETGLEVVVLRPPLVYGPGAPGNFPRLLRWVHRRVPLPLGRVRNERSMLSISNLTDAIRAAVQHARADGEVFLVADDEIQSTPELIRTLGLMMRRPARLMPVPVSVLRMVGRAIGRDRQVQQLVGSLAVSTEKIRTMLDWTPPQRAEEGLRESVDWFLQSTSLLAGGRATSRIERPGDGRGDRR